MQETETESGIVKMVGWMGMGCERTDGSGSWRWTKQGKIHMKKMRHIKNKNRST